VPLSVAPEGTSASPSHCFRGTPACSSYVVVVVAVRESEFNRIDPPCSRLFLKTLGGYLFSFRFVLLVSIFAFSFRLPALERKCLRWSGVCGRLGSQCFVAVSVDRKVSCRKFNGNSFSGFCFLCLFWVEESFGLEIDF